MAVVYSEPAFFVSDALRPLVHLIPRPAGRWADPEEAVGEKRQCPRRSLHCSVQMIPLATDQQPHPADAITAECWNISEGGLYATVPIGYGMAVGQRYVFRLRTRELGPDGQQVVLRQGVVLRTELQLSSDGDQVGVGVRFCGHRSGVLVTPAEA